MLLRLTKYLRPIGIERRIKKKARAPDEIADRDCDAPRPPESVET